MPLFLVIFNANVCLSLLDRPRLRTQRLACGSNPRSYVAASAPTLKLQQLWVIDPEVSSEVTRRSCSFELAQRQHSSFIGMLPGDRSCQDERGISIKKAMRTRSRHDRLQAEVQKPASPNESLLEKSVEVRWKDKAPPDQVV